MFENTVVPRDFDRVEIPFPERGEPKADRGHQDRERMSTTAERPRRGSTPEPQLWYHTIEARARASSRPAGSTCGRWSTACRGRT